MLTVQPPQLNFNSDAIPCCERFDDPYFSLLDPLRESQYVFLNSTHIRQRWRHKHFTIGELGFGFGINFLSTAQAWIEQHSSNHSLNFISIEKYPVAPADLVKCYQRLKIAPALTGPLLRRYPLPVRGFHRIEFSEHNIFLTLIFGEAIDCLKECDAKADAWYLDGFAPSKNPALWTPAIAAEIYRLTHINGTFSTYSAASQVSKAFAGAGFKINKMPGFGKKRAMMTGQRQRADAPSVFPLKQKSWLFNAKKTSADKSAVVIGAGLAGCIISAALARRGWQVTLIERHARLASAASGNPNAILMPRLSIDHDAQAQLTLCGYLYSIRYLHDLQNDANSFGWRQCGVIQIPRDESQWRRMNTIASQEAIPTALLQPVSRRHASELSQCEIAHDGWYMPLAGYLDPRALCQTLMEKYASNINIIFNTQVTSISNHGGKWRAYADHASEIHAAGHLIVANAFSARQFNQTAWCELQAKRGQITLIPASECNMQPSRVICADAYITPDSYGNIILGASFISNDTNTDVRPQEQAQNIQKIQKIMPAFTVKNIHSLNGRVAIRAVSRDRLPIVGPVANKSAFDKTYKPAALGSTRYHYPRPDYLPGLYLLTGFGSRGLAWIPLCSEALACDMCGQPSPLSRTLRNAIHPNRILMKNLTRRIQSK